MGLDGSYLESLSVPAEVHTSRSDRVDLLLHALPYGPVHCHYSPPPSRQDLPG